jgi:transcriptional regulator with XRE-family HTH domain
VRGLREQRGWSQSKLAATAGMTNPRSPGSDTRQVRALAVAADTLCKLDGEGNDASLTRLPLLGAKIRGGGFGGLRLGEQNGLRRLTCSSPAATSTSTAHG